MFAFVEGLLEEVTEESCVIDIGGFGVEVFIPGSVLTLLPAYGEHIKLYTHTQVREDDFSLYGFLSRDALAMFKKLIGVSGIGPKAGLSLLSVLDAEGLRFAICSGDVKAISQAPGVGRKTAERVILELRDKMSVTDSEMLEGFYNAGKGGVMVSESKTELGSEAQDALAALTALGYSHKDALHAISSIENVEALDSGTIMSSAMKLLYH